MKRMLSLVMLCVLMTILAVLPLQAAANTASGPGYSLNPTLLSLKHGKSGTLNATFTIPANTIGQVSLVLNSSDNLGLAIMSNHSSTASLQVSTPYQTDVVFSPGQSYIMLNSAQEPQRINWEITTILNSVTNQYSGSFTINVEHQYGDSVVTPPTCTEDGFTTHTCTLCGYSYRDTPISATGHTWGAWAHDASTSGAAATHSRTCGNDASHRETEGCSFTSVVTAPTCMNNGFTINTCTVCNYSYTSDEQVALGHDFRRDATRDKAATCTTPGVEAWACIRCGEHNDKVIAALGHSPGEWEVTVPPTNTKTGTQVKRCTLCGELLETMKIPVLSMIWPDNTACSFGPRFRDESPELTDKWYMYTPLDLTKEGSLDVPLIASNRYRIGTARVTAKDGQVFADYQVTADKVEVKEEFMTFLPGIEGLTTVEPEALTDRVVPFGTPVDIVSLGESGQALFFMRLVITYDIYADGVEWWSMR